MGLDIDRCTVYNEPGSVCPLYSRSLDTRPALEANLARWMVFKLTAKDVDMPTEQAYWEKNVSKLYLVDGRMVRYPSVQVRRNIEGTLEQEVRSVRKVYRRIGGQVDLEYETLDMRSDRDAIHRFMTDYVVDPELIERTLKMWDEQVSNTRSMGNGRTYKWRSGLKSVQYTFELRSLLALINTLVHCMPEPVQEIRHTLVHGDDGEQKNKADILFRRTFGLLWLSSLRMLFGRSGLKKEDRLDRCTSVHCTERQIWGKVDVGSVMPISVIFCPELFWRHSFHCTAVHYR